MEPVTSEGGEHSNAGGIQEKIGQPSFRFALIWTPALSRSWTQWPYRPPPTPLFFDSINA